MPLDHYVSQVHLKNFYSPKLENLMYAIRKSDLKFFTPNAQSVCRIEDGSTNPYLEEERVIEEFLKTIEPKYNKVLEKLLYKNIDSECIYTVAGFIAYVLICSPTGTRIHSSPLESIIEDTAQILEKSGKLPSPPPELGGETLTELLNSGKVHIDIDPKYPQAIGISSILSHVLTFGNFTWDIMINPFEDNPFFTSDFPIAIEKTHDQRILNKIVPLSPKIAIRIHPDTSFNRNKAGYTFSNFRYAFTKLKRQEVVNINRLIVRCAEDMIFFRDNHDWIQKFVKKNSSFRIENKTLKIPTGSGSLTIASQEIAG